MNMIVSVFFYRDSSIVLRYPCTRTLNRTSLGDIMKHICLSTMGMLSMNGTVADENLVLELAQAGLRQRRNKGRVAGEKLLNVLSR